MKSDVNGCSTAENGQEQYEVFYSKILKEDRIQYEYRTLDGELFSCIARNLKHARGKRDAWMKKNDK